MGRLLLFLISLALLAGIAYWYVTGGGGRARQAEPPAETMQNLRDSAKKIEKDGLQRAADIDSKATAQ
jgi:hypothetical protein